MAKFFLATIVLGLGILAGCDSYSPDRNTPTSGRLVVMVDEMYEGLVRDLADTFMLRVPSAKVVIEPISARAGIQELINKHLADTSFSDTATTLALVLGRDLLEDEQKILSERRLQTKLIKIPIGYDGLAVVVPNNSPLQQTTLERLRKGVTSEGRTADALQDGAGGERIQFIFSDPNSSAYSLVRTALLNNGEAAAPVSYRQTSDSVLNSVAAGEGISVMSWYRAHLDSARVRTLQLGFTDSTGVAHDPVRVHPTSLVMGLYPLKLHIIGYTFARVNSLANGFLTWLAQSAQKELVNNRGIEGENVRFQLESQ